MPIPYNVELRSIEKNIANTWINILQVEKVGINDNFFELGGHSLLAQKAVAILKDEFNYILPVTKLYQFPTISEIANFLQREKIEPAKIQPNTRYQPSSSGVAVIGMAGRFPGANTVEELWEVLKNGKETIRFFTKSELDPSISDDVKNDPDYIRARGIIENADKFDAAFFGLNPKLAELMDPQQRIFLEIAWELLEKTGHLPQTYNGNIGVYAGTGNNTYYYNNVQGHPELINQVGSFQVGTVNEKDYVSSRTAYQLNLKGPAVSVYSSSSTSLLAVAQAVECIRHGQCDVVIAGGASVTSPVNSGYFYQEGSMLSRDGHSLSFDADATGTVFSDGAGVILLKDIEAAKRDGDTIYAVIKGVGVNNDGGGKGSFMAPSSEGQAKAIAMAMHDAGIDPSTISYVETHGTATPIGDPVEIDGLKMAFGYNPNSVHDPITIGLHEKGQFCAIGSVKSNVGHLTAAAGVTGLIKTVMALHHRQIPPSLGFVKPNPNINFEDSPFYVNTKLAEWRSETARRAGVSSFGVGGTNVHVLLEEFVNDMPVSSEGRPLQLITYSAKSESSLQNYFVKLSDYLIKNSTVSLADIAFTLQTTRAGFNYRRFVLAQNTGDLTDALLNDAISPQTNLTKTPGEVAFMFPGQGSQYLNMGVELYVNEVTYREAVDECALILMPHIGLDIRQIIFPGNSHREAEELLKNTRYAQPAIFVTEYALAKLWMSWGIVPSVFCGHSIGEFVAACFAGIFTLPDALKLIAIRGRMVSELPQGSMLSVRARAKEIAEMMPESLSMAAINSHNLCVVSGEEAEIAVFANLLNTKQIPNKVLPTSHAFHSSMMDAIIEDFEKIVSEVNLNPPPKAIISTVSGSWLTDAQATDPHYWSTHLRSTVLFADATETILKQENVILVEVGPGSTLSTFVRQQSGAGSVILVTSLEKNNHQKSEYGSILKALGQLWLNGLQPDWKMFYIGQKRNRIMLPTYCFNRKYCWVDPVNNTGNSRLRSEKLQNFETDSTQIIAEYPVKRKEKLVNKIKEILREASGIDTANMAADHTFFEIGLDSLLMTQIVLTLKKEFGLALTFRQLNEELATPELLARYIDEKMGTEIQHINNNGNAVDLQLATSHNSSKNTEESNAPEPPVAFRFPPVPGAKLGRDKEGNPGWYIPDKTNPGKFLLLELNN